MSRLPGGQTNQDSKIQGLRPYLLARGSGESGVAIALLKASLSSGGSPHVWGTLDIHLG